MNSQLKRQVNLKEEAYTQLSRRERQIMDVLFEQGECSALGIQERLPEPPSYSAVRAMLSKLEKKNVISHREEGTKYIFFPVGDKKEASGSAARRLVKTFFSGKPMNAVQTLLTMDGDQLSNKDIEQLEQMVNEAKSRMKE